MVADGEFRFSGDSGFRQKVVLAILSHRVIRFKNVGSDEDNLGLKSYQISFLKLLEKLSNGLFIEINHSGSGVTIKPGVLVGGRVEHDCDCERAIGYYLEALIPLALFSKHPMVLTLRGVTNSNADISVDLLRTVMLPFLAHFGVSDEPSLKIKARGSPPLGGGSVEVRLPNLRQLKSVSLQDPGRIKKIRGIAYSTRVSPQMANRTIDGAKELLVRYIPDVYIYTDVYKGVDSGKSPGYGLSLVAESSTNVLCTTEVCFEAASELNGGQFAFEVPESLGKYASYSLLLEIHRGGCVPTCCQWLAFLLIALGPEDVSTLRVSSLSEFTIGYLRDIKKFLGVQFKIKTETARGKDGDEILAVTGVGAGYVNVSKQAK